MKNEYFNPDEFPFEVFGFFEELYDVEAKKGLGCRDIEAPTRPLGSGGMIEYDLTEDVTLTKGLSKKLVKASAARPRRVMSMLQAKCGPLKNRE